MGNVRPGYPKETFVVGAGFSTAVHKSMPTLTSLGEALRETLLDSDRYTSNVPDKVRRQLQSGQVPFGNLELWLSSLAERQPFMTVAAGLRNQALFGEITELLVRLVCQAQNDFWSTAPGWLHRLLRLWHRRRTTVVTFNYDTIIELAMAHLDAPGSEGDIIASILAQLPRRAAPLQFEEVLAPSFRLHKLHGSLDWYWNPDDDSGESLCRLAAGVTDDQARAAVAGKAPFVVPPLTSKAPFYSLGLLRQLWQEAAAALDSAERIVVIGYSVPLTDLATAAMLTGPASSNSEWHVVNPDAESVGGRLVNLGVRPDAINYHRSAEDWVDWYEHDHSGRMSEVLLQQLSLFRTKEMQFAPIQLRRTRGDFQVARRIVFDESQVILEAAPMKQGEVFELDFPREPNLLEVLGGLNSPTPVRAKLEGINGLHEALGALDPSVPPIRGAYGNLDWCAIELQDVPVKEK